MRILRSIALIFVGIRPLSCRYPDDNRPSPASAEALLEPHGAMLNLSAGLSCTQRSHRLDGLQKVREMLDNFPKRPSRRWCPAGLTGTGVSLLGNGSEGTSQSPPGMPWGLGLWVLMTLNTSLAHTHLDGYATR
jgi:hypothetical protein